MAGGAAQGRGRDRTEREDRLRYLGVHQTRGCDFSPVRADRVCGGDTAGLMQETIIKAVLKEPPEQRGGSLLCPENLQKSALQETAGNTHEFFLQTVLVYGIIYQKRKETAQYEIV